MRIAAALALIATAAHAAAPTVAVMPFRDLTRPTSAVGEAIRETVTTDLKQLGAVRVVERGNLDRVLAEQHVQASSEIDPSTAARVGKLLGATHILAGAYQEVGPQVRLTARFIRVETGEVVGVAKVDGKGADLLRLQDRITAELLRSTGMASHAKRFVERSRPDVKPKVLELYGQSVLAQNDDQRRQLLVLALNEDKGFTYASDDLAALEKRLVEYEAKRTFAAEKALAELREKIAAETDPAKKGPMVVQLLTGFVTRRRFVQLAVESRAVLAQPALPTVPNSDTHDVAGFYLVTAHQALRNHDAVLRDGEAFLRAQPNSMYFSAVKSQVEDAIRHKREAEEKRAELPKALAEVPPRLRWDLCHLGYVYRGKQANAEARRMFRACLEVGHTTTTRVDAMKMLLWIDLDLADWQQARRDLAALEKESPEAWRHERDGVLNSMPADG